MRLPLKNACETSRCLVVDRWSNDKSDSVIVLIVAIISLIINDYVVQNNGSTHDQFKSTLGVRLVGMASMLNLFFSRSKAHFTSFLNVDYFAEKNICFSSLQETMIRSLVITEEHSFITDECSLYSSVNR
jgi:hypothetical protein